MPMPSVTIVVELRRLGYPLPYNLLLNNSDLMTCSLLEKVYKVHQKSAKV